MWERVPDHLKGSEKRLLVDGTRLAESYRLCEAAGINREIARPKDMLSGADLNEFIGRNATLVHLARDLFANTHRQIVDNFHSRGGKSVSGLHDG